MSKKIIYPPKDLQNPYIKSFKDYEVMYKESIEKPKEFFTKMALENLCLLYTSPSPRDLSTSRMPSSA